MQTQGRREAEQTLPGAGGVPLPLCEAHRLACALSRPRDSITVTARRELAALRGADAVTASGVQGQAGGERVPNPPQQPSCLALLCPATDAFFSITQLSDPRPAPRLCLFMDQNGDHELPVHVGHGWPALSRV
ncbi:unnamed protein product, partial [Rangifer tarandus platyrhynchus]